MKRSMRYVTVLCVMGVAAGLWLAGCGTKEGASVATGAGEAKKTGLQPEPTAAPAPEPPKAGSPEPAVVRKCAAGPVIDGDLSDACWKPAEIQGLWIDVLANRQGPQQPKVRLCYDDDNFYVVFDNPEPNMGKLVAYCGDRDGNVWEDDSNEIFLDPTAGKDPYYQFIVNTRGVMYDGRGQAGEWNSRAKAAVRKTEDAWTLEISIPLSDLGVVGSPAGQTWTANFCRNILAGGQSVSEAWADTGSNFHTPEAFGKLKME
jgi:hypothetical protein